MSRGKEKMADIERYCSGFERDFLKWTDGDLAKVRGVVGLLGK